MARAETQQPSPQNPAPDASVATPSTVEDWARTYIECRTLVEKLNPPPVPSSWAQHPEPPAAPALPGRPPEVVVVAKVRRSRVGTSSSEARARLLHTFMHHELQAAELMAWALLRFPSAEPAFKRGLLAICLDEIRHLNAYAALLTCRGVAPGSYPVRDWFWERVPTCTTALQFVSLMGLGVEAANLEHSSRFAKEFESAGDNDAAELQRKVEADEVNHVAFGRYWYERWAGVLTFDAWKAELPAPLSPLLMRAIPLNLEARSKAGLNPEFLRDLAAWTP